MFVDKCDDCPGTVHQSCNLCHEAAVENDSLKWAVRYGEAASTGHLARHIKVYHPDEFAEHSKKEAKVAISGPMDKFKVKSLNFEQKYLEWVVDTYQPISTCEQPSFRDMMEEVNKNCPKLDRHTCMNKLKEAEYKVKAILVEVLKEQDVSVTLDHWTSSSNVNYVAQTVHFIDENFDLVKLTLACDQHKGSSAGKDSKEVRNTYAVYCILP
jgi:hypothetical protein